MSRYGRSAFTHQAALIAVVTALVLVMPAGRASAQASAGQLLELERLVLSGDVDSLYTYILNNPALLLGEDDLARELNTFVESVSQGQVSRFSEVQPAGDRDAS
jgi:hypothetical protein